MSGRLIDPRQHVERGALEREGWISQRGLLQRDEEAVRFDKPVPQITWHETLSWYRENIPGTVSTAYGMRSGIPSSQTAWASVSLPQILPAAARVLVARLQLSEAWVGGAINLRLRVVEGSDTSDYDLEEVTIDGTADDTHSTQQAVAVFSPETAIQIAKGGTVECRIWVSATFTPTTADATATVTFGYE